MKNKPLTPKQQLFIDLYLANGYNATRAYKDAGYKARSDAAYRAMASQLLAEPCVSLLIQTKKSELLESIQAKTRFDRERVIRELIEIVKTASTVAAVKVEGKAIVLWQPNAAVRALELLGKEIGMFIDKRADVTESVKDREKQLELVKRALAILNGKKSSN